MSVELSDWFYHFFLNGMAPNVRAHIAITPEYGLEVVSLAQVGNNNPTSLLISHGRLRARHQ
jgi:hypothetical protein